MKGRLYGYNIYINSDYNGHTDGFFLNKLSLIYNPNNYNGLPYIDVSSLVPNSGVLYDNLDNIIFARNLYNKIISESATTSTLEIPNKLLNDILISKQNLVGETNITHINNNDVIQKNIYETVYLNFTNLINIVNNNNDNSILNTTASAKLNHAINTLSEYDNTKMTKYRINYEDGTSIVSFFNIENQQEIYDRYTLTLTFYLNKKANNLEFISNDEQTVYCTIDLSNYEINKLYSLKQRVRIGGENERRREKNKNYF